MSELQARPNLLVDCIHPDDAPFVDLFSKVLLSNLFEQSEYRIITVKGNIKWLLERKQIVKNELGVIVRLDAVLIDITEQKDEELRLIESESTFKSLFYKHPNPMWVYDTESLFFLAVNDSAIKFYGYTHDEFFRMTVRQIRPQEDVKELLWAIRNNNFAEYSEKTWRHIKKDGSIIYVKLQSNPINFRGHKARTVLAMDITKQVEAEFKTEKVYKYLEHFQEAVSKTNLLGLMDSSGNISFVNQCLLEKTEFNSSRFIGKKWNVLFSNSNLTEDFDEVWTQIKGCKIWKTQRKFARKGGSHFWVNCAILPILDGESLPTQYLMIADDITTLKEAEKSNREYAIKLHSILEGVTDAIFVLDKNWLLTNINKEAERLLEKKGSFLLGKNIWEVFPAEEGFKFYQFFRKAKKRKITVQFEEYYAPKKQWFDISIYPSKDGLAVCFRDVSERKKKDDERREILEQLIIQNRDLEEFTYITSHSLRAQIANMSMLSAAIDPNGLTPMNQEIFERLFQSSSNLDGIISDLNTILTVKNSKPALYEDIQPANIFINAISKIPHEFGSFKKCIKTDFEKLNGFKSVRGYIETILFQLIVNSIKFRSPNRTPEILMHSELQENTLVISVSDNGMGIDTSKYENQLFKLYKKFHLGISGKGLGLYLSKLLVEELNGTIEIDSKIDVGTNITIRLPKQR